MTTPAKISLPFLPRYWWGPRKIPLLSVFRPYLLTKKKNGIHFRGGRNSCVALPFAGHDAAALQIKSWLVCEGSPLVFVETYSPYRSFPTPEGVSPPPPPLDALVELWKEESSSFRRRRRAESGISDGGEN